MHKTTAISIFFTKTIFVLIGCSILVLLIPVFLSLQKKTSILSSQALADTTVGQYEKFELTYTNPSPLNYSNPDDPNIVDVEATVTAPSGGQLKIPGFFFQDMTRSLVNNQEVLATQSGTTSWKVRFAPRELGQYSYIVTLTDTNGTQTLGSGTFTSVASSNHGFIKASGYHLVFDDSTQFIPLGLNAPWFQYKSKASIKSTYPATTGWGDGTYGMDNLISMMKTHGANAVHVWTCSWSDGVATAFAKPNIGCDGNPNGFTPPSMDQLSSWEMDYLLNLSHTNGIYVLPVLKHHDQGNWEYNDQIKSRYFVARWGYDTSILGWDFEKEGATNPALNNCWANFMETGQLNSNCNAITPFPFSGDIYKHIRSTSQFNHYPTLSTTRLGIYNQVFGDPLMSFVQNHDYSYDCTSTYLGQDPGFNLFNFKFSASDPRNFSHFGNKPSFFGETGLATCGGPQGNKSALYNVDTKGLIIKSQLWGMIMGSAGGFSPWDFSFDFNGTWTQYSAFDGISVYASALPTIPDSASLITSYYDSSQVAASDNRLVVYGRKNTTFSMFFVQNTTGTPIFILQGQKATPVNGIITLKNMVSLNQFTVKWYNTDTGAVLSNTTITSDNAGNLNASLPQAITQNIAAIITTNGASVTETPTSALSPTPIPTTISSAISIFTPTPTLESTAPTPTTFPTSIPATPMPTLTSTPTHPPLPTYPPTAIPQTLDANTSVALSLLLPGIGTNPQNIYVKKSGTLHPLHPTRTINVTLKKEKRIVSVFSTKATYDNQTGFFSAVARFGKIPTGIYSIEITMDNYVQYTYQSVALTQGLTNPLPQVMVLTESIGHAKDISIIDYNIIRNCFKQSKKSIACSNIAESDINDDGVVDYQDLNLLLDMMVLQNKNTL